MNKTLIISIHGILSNIDEDGHWQNSLDKWLHTTYATELANKELVHLPFSYGLIGPIWAFIINTLSWAGFAKYVAPAAVKRFKSFLKATAKNYPGYKLHIIAHSFGTWVSHLTLDEMLGQADIKIEGWHLFGAVISAHVQRNSLDELLMAKQLEYCVMWSSHNDTVVRFLAVPPFGHAGYWGIIRDYHPEDRVIPAWKPYEHLQLYNRLHDSEHTECLTVERFPQLLEDILHGPKA